MPKVVRFHRRGDADVLQIDEIPMPEAAACEVVINVEAFGLNRAKQHVCEWLEDRSYRPVIDSVFAFEDLADAQRHMLSNEQMGKIVVKI